jgi:hypothetical protein
MQRLLAALFVLAALVLALALAPATALSTSAPITVDSSVELGARPRNTPTPTATPNPSRLTCPSATTLEQLVNCIIAQGPYSSGAGYVEPSSIIKRDWQATVRLMMEGRCDMPLPSSLAPIMSIKSFLASDNGKRYCVFYETADANGNGKVDKGWGTFIVYPTSSKPLVIQAPHPVADTGTQDEAIAVFKDTGARAYLLMGAHRSASSTPACQYSYQTSDPAHDVRDVFNPTVVELKSYYGGSPWWSIQFHGMAVDNCSSQVHMSNGFSSLPPAGTKIRELHDVMSTQNPSWDITLSGEGCSLNATTSTTGRIINGIPISSACKTSAITNTGAFIHIEQDPAYRSAGRWTPAINVVWP